MSEAVAAGPVVAVPIATGAGRTAPRGLDEADLAYVAFPGPGAQRVVALYQSRLPERVGPLAQTRPMDGKLVPPFDAVLQYGGGAASFVRQLDQADVAQWSSLTRAAGFERDAAGVLYALPSVARDDAGGSAPPFGVLPFADEDAMTQAEDAQEIRVTMPSQAPLTLRYDRRQRRWEGSLGQVAVAATNVVLQEAEYEQLVLPKTGGATERDPVLVAAAGKATVLRPQGATSGTWNRRGRATLTSYVGEDGVPVRLTPGTTWVLLVPGGTQVRGAG